MSTNIEKADTISRVTRSSMRKMNSSDSLNVDAECPETPTGRMKNAKLDSINEEAVLTPLRGRGTRAGSAQRNLLTEQSIASPRRTTRRMSSESKEAVASPARLTRSRRSIAAESEDDDLIFVGGRTMAVVKSTPVVKLEEVIEELPEQEQEGKINEKSEEATSDNLKDLNKSTDSTNELELRNRSISKSPCVAQRNSISSNDIISVHDNTNSTQNDNNSLEGSNTSNEESQKSKSPSKSQTKKKSLMNSFDMSTRDSDSCSKSIFQKNSSSIVESISSNSISEVNVPQNNVSEELVSKLMEDFVPETKKQSNSDGQTDVPLQNTASLINKTQINQTDMAIESEEEESMHNETNKQLTDMDLTNFLENKNSGLTMKNSNTWNLSARGSTKQIDSLKEPEKEIIYDTSAKKQRKVVSSDESNSENEGNPFIDAEAEVADSDMESMTKSERDYWEQNEIPDDGESIGSQDSVELDEEEEEYENDSFIDHNEDMSDTYSMDSNDKILEEEELNNSKKKRKSRILPQSSSSEDEASKSPEKIQLSAKKNREFLNSSAKSEIKHESSPSVSEPSPLKTQKSSDDVDKNIELSVNIQKSDNKSRKSLPIIQELPKNKKLDKKSRKSMPNVQVSFENQENGNHSDESPVKTQNSAKNDRKSLDIHALSENMSNKNQKSAMKSRLSLPNIQDISQNTQKPIQTLQLGTKKRKSYISDSKTENEKNEQNFSSDINIFNSNNSLNNTDSSVKESSSEEKSLARKRKRENDEENSASKRFRKMSPNETEALHMDDQSSLIENDGYISIDEVSTQKASKEVKKKKKVVEILEQSSDECISDDPVNITKKKTVNVNTLLERCNEYMEKTKEEKRAKMALKKERKAKKLEQKKKLQNGENQIQENLDSSNGENKENATKKKKKNKKKKQNFLDEIDDEKKEDLSSKLDKLQQKLELKRQRKKEKKIAKLAQQKEANLMETSDDNKMSQKSNKVQSSDTKTLKTSSKHVLMVHEEPLEISGGKKNDKKGKTHKEVEVLRQEDVKVKNSKKSKEVDEFSQKVHSVPVNQEIEKKKPKKRPISEVVDDNDTETVEKPKAKKKLNILNQVECTNHVLGQMKFTNQNNNADSLKHPSNLSSKLNQIIPKGLGNDEKPPSKKKSQKNVADFEKKPSKRPIRTTAGTFIEESIVPYTFKLTKYKPINVGSSTTTKYGVFSAKKKSSGPSVVDFKMQAMLKRSKNRDKSIKNLKNLM